MDTNLVSAIDELVEKKTFSLDALTAIHELRSKAQKSVEAEVASRETISSQAANITKLNAELGLWRAKDDELKARDNAVAKREGEITKLERETAVAQAGMNVMRETVGMFLRNRVVRENIVSSTPVAVAGAGGTMGYVSNYQNTETTSREEE